jgi:hypothetical protein
MKVISVRHWNALGMPPEEVRVIEWLKDFDLMISADGKYYIDPRSRCYIRDNHLKTLLKKDVHSPSKVIDRLVDDMRRVTAMMGKDRRWMHLAVDLEPSGEYLGSYEP